MIIRALFSFISCVHHFIQITFDFMQLSVPELLDVLAKKTLVLLDSVYLPKPQDYVVDQERPSVSSEIGAIQAGLKELVEELIETPISFLPAAIKLVGLHGRIYNLFTFCRLQKEWPIYILDAPTSLEMITKETLRRTMANTVEFYTELQKQPNKDICEPTEEGEETLSELLVILVKKTTLLLKEIPRILVPSVHHAMSLPLRNFMQSATLCELDELQEMCDVLREKAGTPDILDQVAFGTFLGLDGRLRDLLFVVVTRCFHDGKFDDSPLQDGTLESAYKSSLERSMSDVRDCLKDYVKKETE
jgi:hypothetical protein